MKRVGAGGALYAARWWGEQLRFRLAQSSASGGAPGRLGGWCAAWRARMRASRRPEPGNARASPPAVAAHGARRGGAPRARSPLAAPRPTRAATPAALWRRRAPRPAPVSMPRCAASPPCLGLVGRAITRGACPRARPRPTRPRPRQPPRAPCGTARGARGTRAAAPHARAGRSASCGGRMAGALPAPAAPRRAARAHAGAALTRGAGRGSDGPLPRRPAGAQARKGRRAPSLGGRAARRAPCRLAPGRPGPTGGGRGAAARSLACGPLPRQPARPKGLGSASGPRCAAPPRLAGPPTCCPPVSGSVTSDLAGAGAAPVTAGTRTRAPLSCDYTSRRPEPKPRAASPRAATPPLANMQVLRASCATRAAAFQRVQGVPALARPASVRLIGSGRAGVSAGASGAGPPRRAAWMPRDALAPGSEQRLKSAATGTWRASRPRPDS
jgi:hypothetical protein